MSITGGGIYLLSATLTASGLGVTIRDNEAVSGAGAYLSNASVLRGATVMGNVAATGGGVYLESASRPYWGQTVEDCDITQNTAQRGGGVYVDPNGDDMEHYMVRVSIQGNVATTAGGGVFVVPGALLEGEDTQMLDNHSDGNGGAIEGEIDLIGGSLLRNVAASGGAAHLGEDFGYEGFHWEGVDLGLAANENVPDDVFATKAYDFAGVTTVSCDPGGC